MTTLLTPDILWVVDGATREIVAQRLPDGTDQPLSADAVTGSGQAVTTAEFDALVLASGLTIGTTYYLTDGPAMWFATGAATYVGVQFEQSGVTYVGDEAIPTPTDVDLPAGTWATRPTSDPDAAGVVCYRRMTDIGTAPGGTVMVWLCGTSTEWSLTGPLHMRLRGAGTTSTSPQYPTNTRYLFPAGFFSAIGRFDVRLKFDQSDETSTLTSWRLKLGSAGTATDATICAPTGSPLAAGDNQRGYPMSFNIESTTTVRADGISNAAAVGWQTSAVNSAADAVAALAGSDDTADALYLGVDYTMGVSNTALTATVLLTLYPV